MAKKTKQKKTKNQDEGDTTDLNASVASSSSLRGKFEVPSLTLKSCSSFERKFIVAPDNATSLKFYKLPHPKTNSFALYQIDDKSVFEVLQLDGERSCFYGNTVVKDCVVTMLSPIHPFFLVLPKVLKQTASFTMGELTKDVKYPALALLIKIPGFAKALKLSCDLDGDSKFIRNDTKLSLWLEKRFNLLIEALKSYSGISDTIKSSEESLHYFAFDIFSDCIPNELSKELHSKWYIRKPVVQPSLKSSENVAVGVKRELQVKASSTTKKSANSTAKKRKLMADSSVMKLTAFLKK